MFKKQKHVLIAGVILFVLYICLFKFIFAPLHYGFIFYFVAAEYAFMFCAMCSSFFPYDEAKGMVQKKGDTQKYKTNKAYTVISIVAILLLLISITLVLATMVLNQHEIVKVAWYYQILVFFAGFTLLLSILGIYEISDTWTIPRHWTTPWQEAKDLVQSMFIEHLGVGSDQVVPDADIEYDLGADILDNMEILIKISEALLKKYKHSPEEVSNSIYVLSPRLREWCSAVKERIQAENRMSPDEIEEDNAYILYLAPTVHEQCLLYEEIITILRYMEE